MKYWLHRISHCYDLSKPLLDRGYLSIGFADYMNEYLTRKNQEDSFEDDIEKIYGKNMYSRHSLKKFLFRMEESDVVLVPSWGTFSLYKIAEKAMPVANLDLQTNDMPKDLEGNQFGRNAAGFFLYPDKTTVDIGFVIKVEPIAIGIQRNQYCESTLISRMKVRQTTVDITQLKQNVINAKEKFDSKTPIQIKFEVFNQIKKQMITTLQNMSNPDEFEKIIEQYFKQIGADIVSCPRKNAPGRFNGADADIVATFEALKCVVYVQAKHHIGETSDWAIVQINNYAQQKSNDSDEYTYLSWVVSTGNYSEDTKAFACGKNVRLISGEEFAYMLFESGFPEIK